VALVGQCGELNALEANVLTWTLEKRGGEESGGILSKKREKGEGRERK